MDALIVVDVQNDFLPGGSLAVPDGDAVIPVINALLPEFELVVATQDWHPPDHRSFASQHAGRSVGDVIDLNGQSQILWPDHCVQGSVGAAFASALDTRAVRHVFHKGTDVTIDSYSGFFDNGHRRSTGLHSFLQARGATRVVVVGLATDYCVRYTALDAVSLGFDVVVVENACRGVDLNVGDVSDALRELTEGGVRVCNSCDLFEQTA